MFDLRQLQTSLYMSVRVKSSVQFITERKFGFHSNAEEGLQSR